MRSFTKHAGMPAFQDRMNVVPNTPESAPFLFVYGTLMKGFREGWQRTVGAEFVGSGTIRARLYDLGDFPGARLFSAELRDRVSGELYRLRDSTAALNALDKYEEYFPLEPKKSLFIRKAVSVTMGDGRRRRAWAYFYNRAVSETQLISGGRYRDRVAPLQSSLTDGSHT